MNEECKKLGHDLNADASACLRCGETAKEGFRLLKRPYMLVQGTDVKKACAIKSADDYRALPLITVRDELRVGEDVFVMDLMGDVCRAKVESVDGDNAVAVSGNLVCFLAFAKDARKAWACPSTMAREMWERGGV
jgi:hypothetical protein